MKKNLLIVFVALLLFYFCLPIKTFAYEGNNSVLNIAVTHGGGGGTFDTTTNEYTCEGIFSDEMITFLVDILGYIKLIVPLLIIVLGSTDLLRSVFAGKDDDIKKGWSRLIKRIIFGLLVFVLTYIVQIIFPIANDYIGGCLSNFNS